MKVCAISDLHLGLKNHSEKWHGTAKDYFHWLKTELTKQGITDIWFLGDWFHHRQDIAVNTLQCCSDILDSMRDFNIKMIAGNHDSFLKDSAEVNSISLFKGFKNIEVMNRYTTHKIDGNVFSFCPWGTTIEQIVPSHAIFGHFEITSFNMNSFKVCEHGMFSGDLLNKSSLVFSGHFHQRDDRNYDNGRIIYIGNTFEHDWNDYNNTKGYYVFDTKTLLYSFHENTVSPRHVLITDVADIKQGKNNICKFSFKAGVSQKEIDETMIRIQKETDAFELTVYFEKTLKKVNETLSKETAADSMETIFENYINVITTKSPKEKLKSYISNLYSAHV